MNNVSSIKMLVSSWLTRLLPDRTKRLILLSSLAARMCGTNSFDKETISKLNRVMSLSKEDKALVFPMQISKAIWRGDGGDVVLYPQPTSTNSDALVERVMKTIPSWLHYDKEETMSSDISKLLENRSMLAS